VPILAALLLSAPGCGKDDPRGELHHLRGRAEGPADADLSKVGVYVVRSGRLSAGTGTITHPARNVVEFDLTTYGDASVDLVAAAIPRVVPFPGESIDETLERAHARTQGGSREVLLAGETTGYLENVRPGSEGLVIRLERLVLSTLKVRALALEGAPLPDVEVRLESRADFIQSRTGEDGVVAFDDVPVRPWRIDVKPPPKAWPHAAHGRATAVPEGQIIDVPLRRAVVVHARLVDPSEPDLVVAYGDARWDLVTVMGGTFDEAGVMPLAADPDWKEVRVQLQRMGPNDAWGWTGVVVADHVIPVREGATVELKRNR
jgi:hypothetical protein